MTPRVFALNVVLMVAILVFGSAAIVVLTGNWFAVAILCGGFLYGVFVLLLSKYRKKPV